MTGQIIFIFGFSFIINIINGVIHFMKYPSESKFVMLFFIIFLMMLKIM